MKSPFDIDSKAFEPFYDSTVAIHSNEQATSLKACVFEENLNDPLSEMSPSTTCRHISIFIPKTGEGGWNCETMPKRGDSLTVISWHSVPCNDDFIIKNVSDVLDSWQLTAREVE